MIPTVNSFTLSARLPNAQLIIYPDSRHGSLFQHAGAYTSHVSEFLDRTSRRKSCSRQLTPSEINRRKAQTK
jgi:hypothetical protein